MFIYVYPQDASFAVQISINAVILYHTSHVSRTQPFCVVALLFLVFEAKFLKCVEIALQPSAFDRNACEYREIRRQSGRVVEMRMTA